MTPAEATRRWRQKNPKKAREYSRMYYEKHKGRYKEYYQQHREMCILKTQKHAFGGLQNFRAHLMRKIEWMTKKVRMIDEILEKEVRRDRSEG